MIFTSFLKVIRHEAVHNWETQPLLCAICYLLTIFFYLNTDPVLSDPRVAWGFFRILGYISLLREG